MIFISDNPKNDTLVIRDQPLIFAPIFIGIVALLLIAAYGAEQNGDFRTTATFFAIAIAVTGLGQALIRVKTLILNSAENTLILRRTRLFGRQETIHTLPANVRAELVISQDSDGDDLYQAFLSNGNEVSIELDSGQSFLGPSARIVMAINTWKRAT